MFLDPALIEQTLAVIGFRTDEAAVVRALEEFVARRRARRLLELMGTLTWDPSFDLKANRSRETPT